MSKKNLKENQVKIKIPYGFIILKCTLQFISLISVLQLRKLALSGFPEISRAVRILENLTSMKTYRHFYQRKRRISERWGLFQPF